MPGAPEGKKTKYEKTEKKKKTWLTKDKVELNHEGIGKYPYYK